VSAPERRVEVSIAAGLSADGDPGLLRVLLDNLLANAWKFTTKTSPARIEVNRTTINGQVAYYVRDNGAGFDPQQASKLFNSFQRLHAQSDFPGTGVGLATVQRIVDRHGGQVWASAAVNQGATFYFTLG
jgi:light-regulated signal transduction histidine kinase (bacteriophytochrome)